MEHTAMSHGFDTHKYIKALVAKGLKEPQAEVIVSSIVESKDYDLSKLATKDQFNHLQKEIDLIKKDIDHIKETMVTKEDLTNETSKTRTEFSAFREEISKLRTDNNKWMISILLAIIGMIITMILKF